MMKSKISKDYGSSLSNSDYLPGGLVDKTNHENEVLGSFSIIGRVVKLKRERLRMSQEELGQKINVTKSYISKIENGKHFPNLLQIKKLSKALGIHYLSLVLMTAEKDELMNTDIKILVGNFIDNLNKLNKEYGYPNQKVLEVVSDPKKTKVDILLNELFKI